MTDTRLYAPDEVSWDGEIEAAWDAATVGGDRPPRYPVLIRCCDAESPEGYGCTRRGDHVARRTQHVATVPGEVVAVWS
jgi:hypothetical protein